MFLGARWTASPQCLSVWPPPRSVGPHGKENCLDHEITKGRRNLILVNACVITFMATLDGSIVNIALPTIASAFSVGISSVQWVVTSYLLGVS